MYRTKIIIDKVDWIKDIPKIYIVKVDEYFNEINKQDIYLNNNKSIEEMFIIFKNELVVGYDKYKLFYYIIEYLKKHNVKDYFFTYLDLKRMVDLKDCHGLFETITNNKNLIRYMNNSLACVYYRPLYNRCNKPFLVESLFVHYRDADLYILYSGENRELHCFLHYFIIQDIDAYTEDLEDIKKLGGKIVAHYEDFNLEIVQYIDELYINSPTFTYVPHNWIDEFYSYIKGKKKYSFKIYYESIQYLYKLLYNYDETKKCEIINYVIKYGTICN